MRPAPPGSQSGLCLRQPAAQRSLRGPGLGQGPDQGGKEVQWHRRGPGPGGERARLSSGSSQLSVVLGGTRNRPEVKPPGWAKAAPPSAIPARLAPQASVAAVWALEIRSC